MNSSKSEHEKHELNEQMLVMNGSKAENTFGLMPDSTDVLSRESRITTNERGQNEPKLLQKWMIQGNDMCPDRNVDRLKHFNFENSLQPSDEDRRLPSQRPKWTVSGQSRSARPARLTELRSSKKRGK